jgi:hypothetical protein
LKVATRVVSRVRIPASQVFEIMKGLEQQLSKWERTHGNKQRKEQSPPPEGS